MLTPPKKIEKVRNSKWESSKMFSSCCFLLLVCHYALGVGGNEFLIKDATGLVNLASTVNGGFNYSGTTVLLENDIDFSGETLVPIGDIYENFNGIFDGQGHTIRELNLNSSFNYVGLFGFSLGMTIKNVVVDTSCSVINSFISDSSSTYIGGITGRCANLYSDCVIENIVNMASVTFIGNTSRYNLWQGGIVGILTALPKELVMRNCVNYGSVVHSGANNHVYVGGIVGSTEGSQPIITKNCFNYGDIIENGTSNYLYIGGILGGTIFKRVSIENCVSAGKINSIVGNVGVFIGEIDNNINLTITHSYWTSEVGNFDVYGVKDSAANVTVEASLVSLNTITVDSLNSYNSSWSKWLLNTDNKSVTFKVNNGKGFSISSQLILLPSLAESENHTFSGWFEDEDCTKEFNNTSIKEELTLYGGWSYMLTFNFGNGTTSAKSVVYGQKYGALPSASRTGYTFIGWFTEEEAGKGEKATENDIVRNVFNHMLYTHWAANSYAVTLNVNGGDALPISELTVTYGQPYNCLPSASRTGHTFTGWYTEENEGTEVTNKTTANITADNHTLYAHWIANNYTITFDYGNGTVINETLKYNETIIYPKNLTREGYVFIGWKPKPERMPTNDTTVVAQWTEVVAEIESEYVEIVFDKKNITEEEVKEIIKNITQDENFYIERIETDKDTGETKVIIRFEDAEKAKDFVRSVGEGRASSSIKSVRTVPAEQDSFALKVNVMSMTIFFPLACCLCLNL